MGKRVCAPPEAEEPTMPAVRLPKSWILAAVFCALAVGLCGAAGARADDLLNKFKPKEHIAAQKVTAEVQGLMDLALKSRTTNPELARAYLEDGLSRVENAEGLGQAERAALQ